MDAIEKIALALAVSLEAPVVSIKHRRAASNLIAAFPQLALDGREEWAAQCEADNQPGGVFHIPATGVTHAAEILEAVGPQRRDFDAVVRRTVWESPWSEVQS